jgi:hypothetical protein
VGGFIYALVTDYRQFYLYVFKLNADGSDVDSTFVQPPVLLKDYRPSCDVEYDDPNYADCDQKKGPYTYGGTTLFTVEDNRVYAGLGYRAVGSTHNLVEHAIVVVVDINSITQDPNNPQPITAANVILNKSTLEMAASYDLVPNWWRTTSDFYHNGYFYVMGGGGSRDLDLPYNQRLPRLYTLRLDEDPDPYDGTNTTDVVLVNALVQHPTQIGGYEDRYSSVAFLETTEKHQC